MNNQGSRNKTMDYGRQLILAAVSGVEAGTNTELKGRPLYSVLLDSTRDSLTLGAAGACAGWIGYLLLRQRINPRKIIGCGALAFLAGFGWKTRKIGASVAHSALNEVSKVRDQHWLELNPIDYA